MSQTWYGTSLLNSQPAKVVFNNMPLRKDAPQNFSRRIRVQFQIALSRPFTTCTVNTTPSIIATGRASVGNSGTGTD